MRNRLFWILLVLVSGSVLAWHAFKETRRGPILLGFAGPLSGPNSELGVQGRNGATLAVEELNESGGIRGRKLVLISEDDAGPDVEQADRQLADRGVAAIIGHMTSASTQKALPFVTARGLALISPTTAAPGLSGIKDNFFRVISTNESWARVLASYARSRLGLEKIYLVGDSDNATYTEPFVQTFGNTFGQLGGTVAGGESFTSRNPPDWAGVIDRIRASGSRAVVFCAQTSDTAAFLQQLALSGGGLQVLCPSWPYTKELLMQAGRAAGGTIFATGYAEETEHPALVAFKKNYQRRFGWSPGFAAAYAYEAVLVAARGLSLTDGERQGLLEALQRPALIHGLQGDFEMDEFGDVNRTTYLMTVKDGRFVNLDREEN